MDVGEIDAGEGNDDEDSFIDDSSVAATERSVEPPPKILLLKGLQLSLTRHSGRRSGRRCGSGAGDVSCVHLRRRHGTSRLQEPTFPLEAQEVDKVDSTTISETEIMTCIQRFNP